MPILGAFVDPSMGDMIGNVVPMLQGAGPGHYCLVYG